MRPDLVRRLVLIGTAAHIDGYTTETTEWNANLTPESFPPSSARCSTVSLRTGATTSRGRGREAGVRLAVGASP